MRIYYYLLLSVYIIFCMGCEKRLDETTITIEEKEFVQGQTFSEAFLKFKEFIIDTTLKVGQIRFLDVDDNDNLIVSDFLRKEVFILSPNGKLIKTLNPDICTPGFHWSPVFANILNGQIYVINAGPWGYRFDREGNCLGKMDDNFLPPRFLQSFSNNRILGYYALANDLSLKVMNEFGKAEYKFGVFPEEHKNFLTRFDAGGLVVDKFNNIYQMNVSTPQIYKYNEQGKLIKVFNNYSNNFITLDRDINNSSAELINEIKRIQNVSWAEKLFLLTENILLVKLRHPQNKYGLLLIDLDGELACEKEYEIEENLLYAKNGRLYFISDQIVNDNQYLNPKITIYKIKDN